MIDSALAAFGLEDLVVASNGHKPHGFVGRCFGCGQSFLSARRPSPTRRSWCEDCRKAGKPTVQRQADLRARRAK